VESEPFLSVGLTLVTALLALAVLEHWFLVLPVPDEALWTWACRSKTRDGAAGAGRAPRPGRGQVALPEGRTAADGVLVAGAVKGSSAS
jgi:hypothetical protein